MKTSTATEIRGLFDSIAPDYDRLNFLMSLGRHQAWKKLAVGWATQGKPQQVADLCCGTGDLARLWLKRVPSVEMVWGIDFSSQMLAEAKRQSCDPRLRWVEADVLHLPLADASLDAVTMAFGLRNVTNIPRCFEQMYRVLKPGARAVVLDLCWRQDDGFQRWYLQELVPRLGALFQLPAQYAYLAPSLERFASPAEQERLARIAGFCEVKHRTLEQGGIHFLLLQR